LLAPNLNEIFSRGYASAGLTALSSSSKSIVHVDFPALFRKIQMVKVEPGGTTMLSPANIVNCLMLLGVVQVECE
jgi:hypothetical protein